MWPSWSSWQVLQPGAGEEAHATAQRERQRHSVIILLWNRPDQRMNDGAVVEEVREFAFAHATPSRVSPSLKTTDTDAPSTAVTLAAYSVPSVQGAKTRAPFRGVG